MLNVQMRHRSGRCKLHQGAIAGSVSTDFTAEQADALKVLCGLLGFRMGIWLARQADLEENHAHFPGCGA